jgi:5'-phosphate synthase pdxT subunit
MARFDSKVVAVRQGNIMGTAFHPELADDLRVHKQLVKMAVDHRNRAA